MLTRHPVELSDASPYSYYHNTRPTKGRGIIEIRLWGRIKLQTPRSGGCPWYHGCVMPAPHVLPRTVRAQRAPADSPRPTGSPPVFLPPPLARPPPFAHPRASLPLRSVCIYYLPITAPMYHVICREVKDIMIIGLGRGKSVKALAKICCCSERTVRRVRLNWQRYGDVAPPRRGPTGRPRIFDRQAVDHLLGVLEARPDAFLDELQPALEAFARRDGRVDQASLMTVSRMLRREGVTTKALSKIARERSRCHGP
jgi:transposase